MMIHFTMPEIILPQILNGEDKTSPFRNCLRNQYRHLRKWAKRTKTDCFRIYDRQIPEFPLAIDLYAGRFCIHFFASKVENVPSSELIHETEAALKALFGADPSLVFWRTRVKTKETRQYEKLEETKEFFTAHEFGVKFKINLTDYLDTGLFLDHRESRKWVASRASGKRVLNLFAYTCSFSVHAALQGAVFTKSVDLSNTYTSLGRDNFLLNGISLKNHPIVRADCLKFLNEEREKYDLIVIDPPTISRSKKMDQLFDIQIDYISLVLKALKLLSKGGVIFFSTNSRKFLFEPQLLGNCQSLEISKKTLPIDFSDPKIHRCFIISQDLSEEDLRGWG
jgi:23S rRNA (cytosine1962-C5)-methyltransferase